MKEDVEELTNEAVEAIQTLSSRDEISDVARLLRRIPDSLKDKVLPRVVNKIIRGRFLNVAADLHCENEDFQFRQDLIFVLWAVTKHGGDIRPKVINGIVVKVISKECMETRNVSFLCNVLDIMVVMGYRGYSALSTHLTELGLYNKLFELLVTWKNDKNVLVLLLTIVTRLCYDEEEKETETIYDERDDKDISCFTKLVKQNAQIFEDLLEAEPEIKNMLIGHLSVILRKYAGSIGDNELFELLIPSEVFTGEGISTLAQNFKVFPTFEKDIQKQIVNALILKGFICKIVDAYESHPDSKYRENLTYVVYALLIHDDVRCSNLLVKNGVVEYLISECDNESESDVVSNILTVVGFLSWKTLHRSTTILEIGVHTKIYKLLQNNSMNKEVMASETLECFVFTRDQIFSVDGIFRLHESLEAIPNDEEDFKNEVIGQIVSHGFIDKIVEAYGDYHEDDYRKQLLDIVVFVIENCNSKVKSLTVDNGTIDFMIRRCEMCCSGKLICGFLEVFQTISWNRDVFSLSQPLQMEILTRISSLREKWRKNEKVMCAVATMLRYVEDEEGSMLDVISGELLALIDTEERTDVLELSFSAIENIVEKLVELRTHTIHSSYLNADFFSTLFKHFKSDRLESDGKRSILGIVYILVTKFPDTVVKLVKPHSHLLLKRTSSEFYDLRWNGIAEILSYKYFGTRDTSESLEFFVPPQKHMFTTDKLVRMVEIFKAIPYDEKEFKNEVIGRIVSQGFIDKIAEVFENQTDNYFRENFLEVVDIVVEYGNGNVKSSMVKNGTVDFIINTCGTSEESRVVCKLLVILKRFAQFDDDFNLSQSIMQHIISRVPEWCRKWDKTESVLSAMTRALWFIIDYIEAELTFTLEELPTVLGEIIQTNISQTVVEETFEVIERIVHKGISDNMNSLHSNYLNREFFQSLFLHVTSANKEGSLKDTAMKIIMDLARETRRDTIKSLLSPHIDSIRNFCEDDSADKNKMKVNAGIVLYKYMGVMDDSELFRLLIPPRDAVFSNDGVTILAEVLYAFPYEEREMREKLLDQIFSDEGLIKAFGEAYEKNANEIYRTNLTAVLKEMIFSGDVDFGSSLVSSDVTKKLIESLPNCKNEELINNICTILLNLVPDHTNVVTFCEQGVLQGIYTPLKTWPNKQKYIRIEKGFLLQLLTKMVEEVAIKEKMSDIIDNGYNLPEELINIFESSKDLSTMNDVIECIKYALKDSIVLHANFCNQRFIDSCFVKMKSDWLPLEDRVKILWSIVTRLSYNNPHKLSALLAPHFRGQ
ncbi:hypothetical protein ACHWQZ_G009827 [Mnemiopsis leidyi]